MWLVQSSRCFVRTVSSKAKLKNYVFPVIRSEDCEQDYISGWGPGGQKVNKAQNAVLLRHRATGLVVKVHESRQLSENIAIAFERMKFALDRHINGEQCYEEQLKRLESQRQARNNRNHARLRRIRATALEDGQDDVKS